MWQVAEHVDDKRPVVVFDLDGTLTTKDTYLAFLAVHVRRHPHRLFFLPWLAIAVGLFFAKLRSNSWLKEVFWRALVGGDAKDDVELSAQKFWDHWESFHLRQDVLEILKAHQTEGCRIILASASFDIYVVEFAKRHQIAEVICSVAEISNQQQVTGRLLGDNCYGPGKLARLKALLQDERISYAYSDHIADQPLLEFAEQPVAVYPEPRLAKHAAKHGWGILGAT